MGMFDYLRVAKVAMLPDLTEEERNAIEADDTDFQTKSLECGLYDYEIGIEGKLILVRMSEETYHDPPFNGLINFYTCLEDMRWFEFNAWFEKGVMTKIERVYETID